MKNIVLTALVAALVALGVAKWMAPAGGAGVAAAKETAYERVMRTGILRCGYVDYEPANMIDEKTTQLVGVITDISNKIGEKLTWKVEWVKSGGWGTFLTDLEMGKFDAFCGAGWALPPDAKFAAMVGPLYYSGIRAWVRASDARFDNGLNVVNDKAVRIAATDGSLAFQLAQSDFPQANLISLPESMPYSTALLNVATNKADIAFVEDYLGLAYAAANPNQIKNVTPKFPMMVSPNYIYVKKEDVALQQTLQMVVEHMHNTGEIEKIVAKYERFPGALLRVNRPYRID